MLHSVQSCILSPATGCRKVHVTCSNARGRWKCLLSLEILCDTDGSELSPFLMGLSRGLAALCRCVGRVSVVLPCLLKRQDKQQCVFSMFPIPMFQLLCAQKGFSPSLLTYPHCAAARELLRPPVPAMAQAGLRALWSCESGAVCSKQAAG